MRREVMNWLVCPVCAGSLALEEFTVRANDVIEGAIHCQCGESFPVIRSVPRMLCSNLRGSLAGIYPDFYAKYARLLKVEPNLGYGSHMVVKEETMERFGYEWTQFPEYECDNFQTFVQPLPSDFFEGKLGLDVGCGAGRHARQASQLGAEIVAVDLSQAVDSAFKNTSNNIRVHVIQADVYHLPFSRGIFDFIYSLGVLHHLPEPEKAYHALPPYLKSGGALFVWLYAHSTRKEFLEWLRYVAQKMSNKGIRHMAWLCNLVDYGIAVNLYRMLRAVPGLGDAAERAAPLRVREYARHGYSVSYTDWYDRLSAPVTNYYREDELRGWLARSGLSNTRLLPEGDSWWWLYGEASDR